MLAAGGRHCSFVDEQGAVWVCGSNSTGQLGLGKNQVRSKLKKLKKIPPIQGVFAKGQRTMLLDINGDVWVCGSNRYGQFGVKLKNDITSPKKLEGIPCIQAIDGVYHVIALDTDRNVWVRGSNSFFQLGNDTVLQENAFSKLDNLPQIQSLSAGEKFSLFLDIDGIVWATGHHRDGQLGVGREAGMRVTLNQVPSIPPIRAISAGENHSLLLDYAGNVWASGGNSYGQLGLGDDGAFRFTFEKIDLLSDITAVFAGVLQSMFLNKEGSVWVCGLATSGQLGLGMVEPPGEISAPTKNPSLPPINWLSLGGNHSLFLDATGSVWFCGDTEALGLPNNTLIFVPEKLEGVPKLYTVSLSPASPLKSAANV